MINVKMLDAVSGQPASRIRFRGWMGFAVHAAACVALLFAGPLPSAEAQTWNTTTGSWQTPSNWNGGVPSSTSGTAVFQGANQLFLATGTATPSIGQLYFDNSGTTTLQLNRILLNSGTGILLGNSSGNVFIDNTQGDGSRLQAVNFQPNQLWINNSTSGTLSVQTGRGAIFLGDTEDRTLTLSGSGAFRLGNFKSGAPNSGGLIYEGTGLLTLTSTVANSGFFTLKSGTVRNESTGITTPFGSGTTTISGGAIAQVGTGTSTSSALRMDGSFSLVSGSFVFNSAPQQVGPSPVGITVASDSTLFLGSLVGGGVLTGSGEITKLGSGSLVLTRYDGTGFSGGFKLQEGLVVVQSATNNLGLQSNRPFGMGTFTIVGGTLSAGVGMGSNPQNVFATTPVRFEGNFSVGGTAAFHFGTGTVTLATTPTINVVNSAVTATIGGPIVGGANGLTKSGPGQMTLTGSSTYTGLTTVSSGTLEFTTNGSVDGNIDNNGMVSFNRTAYTYGGVISGTGNLFKGQNVTLTLNGTNTFSGTTSFASSNPGIIMLGNNLALQNSGIDTAGAGTITAPTSQTSLTIGGLIGSKNFSTVFTTNLGTTVTSLTLNPQAGRSYTYSGTIANVGTRTLSKTGAGEQILSAVNTYTGLTTVSAGRLTIGGGNINASSGVTVNGAGAEFRYNSATAFNKTLTLTQGILSGTGTINTAVTVGSNATISPGNSPGSQTYTSSQWLQDGTYKWEINDLSGAAGTNWDKVVVTNLLDLTGLSASNKFNINLTTLTGSNTDGPLDSAYVSGPTYIFPFVDFSSLAVGGTFSSSANSDLTALFNFNLGNWLGTPKPEAKDISVKVNSGGTGLNLVIVPEPATIALAGIGIGTAVWFFRRRRAA